MKYSKVRQLSDMVSDIRADSEAFTDDVEVADAFDEDVRQQNLELRAQLLGGVQRTLTPMVSGGDLDVDVRDAESVGETAVGGQNPTPEQDLIDEIGEAVGIVYNDDEPLATTQKLERRDHHRWELDPASSEDYRERHS